MATGGVGDKQPDALAKSADAMRGGRGAEQKANGCTSY